MLFVDTEAVTAESAKACAVTLGPRCSDGLPAPSASFLIKVDDGIPFYPIAIGNLGCCDDIGWDKDAPGSEAKTISDFNIVVEALQHICCRRQVGWRS